MEASAVGRLICVTGFEAGDSCSCGGSLYNAALYLFGRLYSDKDDQERIIPKSRLDWTVPPEPLHAESVEQAEGGFP